MRRLSNLRDHLDALREIGELVEIEREVDWNLEMAAIARRCAETGAPAVLFSDVKDAEPGFRAVSALIGESYRPEQRFARLAVALGLPVTSPAADIIEAIVAARGRVPIPPRIVDSGPVKQNVRLADDVDMTRLPLPLLHHGDGGRYLNTLGMIIARTPDRKWTSWSIARIMLLDARRAVGVVAPFQHIGKVHAAWRELGQDMPFAVAFGMEPLAVYAAGMPLPADYDEADFVGAYAGEPVGVVRCETIDLEVPATAELVLEGHVSITDIDLEGPMGEYGGYMAQDFAIPQPVYHVTAMTFRDDPILPFTCAGEPPDEDHTVWGVASTAEAVHMLRSRRVPVTTAWSPFETACGWLVVTVPDTWKEYEPDAVRFCRRVAEIVLSEKAGDPFKTIVVIADDVDPSNLRELIWAIDGRNDRGDRGQIRLHDQLIWPVSPYVNPDPTNFPRGWDAARLVWNCLAPEGIKIPPRTGFKQNYPEAVQRQVLENWERDGLPPDARL